MKYSSLEKTSFRISILLILMKRWIISTVPGIENVHEIAKTVTTARGARGVSNILTSPHAPSTIIVDANATSTDMIPRGFASDCRRKTPLDAANIDHGKEAPWYTWGGLGGQISELQVSLSFGARPQSFARGN